MDDEYIYVIVGTDKDAGHWCYFTPEKAAQYASQGCPGTVVRYKVSEPTEVTFKTEVVEIPRPEKKKSPPIKTLPTAKY